MSTELDYNGLKDATNCTRCRASLERGCQYVWVDHVLTDSICHKCGNKEDLAQYLRTGKRLRSFFTTSNMLTLYHTEIKKSWDFQNRDFLEELRVRIEAQQSVDRIHDKIKEFESTVWFGGLQDIIRKSKVSGVSARSPNFNDFKVLTYCSCARTMFTFSDKDSDVTAITEEDSDEHRMGMQGIDATESEAIRLINLAISLWKDGALKFKADKKVSII